VWLLNVVVLFLGYFFPLMIRFIFFRRSVQNLAVVLLLFPVTLLFADLFTSILSHFSILSRSKAAYVPAFYLVGLGPLFVLLHAHCLILGLSSPDRTRKSTPLFRRLTAHTFTLALSVVLSMVLCASVNREKTPAAFATSSLRQPDSRQAQQARQAWQILELTDAGILEIPGSWYVEDSNGNLTQARHDGSEQYIREALTALPYGQRESGLDFAFELMVYWWRNLSEHMLSPPRGIVDRIQENQLDSIKREFSDIAYHDKELIELGGRVFSVLTIETNSIPGIVVRFKNIVLEHGDKVYTITVSYPAYEENFMSETLDLVLSRWRP
jgi:hypothetical protein